MRKLNFLVELKNSPDSGTFVTALLLVVTFTSWALMIFFFGTDLATLLAAEGFGELTEIAHVIYFQPGIGVLVSVFFWLPVNAFLALMCYLRLPFEIEIKIKRR